MPTLPTHAYAVLTPNGPFVRHVVERRSPGPRDVSIDVLYCGICHSDIHQARDEWGGGIFPMVPGHEIVGKVSGVGAAVTKWRAGDVVGVGCMVDSCRTCEACGDGEEQFCANKPSFTYNSFERDGKTPTYGGYSARMTVNEDFVLRIPAGLPLEGAAPLLCAGITTYSPLKRYGVKKGQEIGIVGLGGLGHMGVKIAKAMGARVTVLSHSPSKRADAFRLGADDFIATKSVKSEGGTSEEADPFARNAGRFDFLLDTVSATHDYNAYLRLLKRDCTMVLVGIPDPTPVDASALVMRRRKLAGSLIGGIRETQEMLDFCAAAGISADVEVVSPERIDEAFERTVKSDVRYRFVIDFAQSA